jgi:hypothetical protein
MVSGWSWTKTSLGLRSGEGDGVVVEHVVGKGALAAGGFAVGPNLPGGDVDLFADLLRLPPGLPDGGRDVAGADLLFGQLSLVHLAFARSGWGL